MRARAQIAFVLAVGLSVPLAVADDDPGKMRPAELLKKCSEKMEGVDGHNLDVSIQTSSMGQKVSDLKMRGAFVRPDVYGFDTDEGVAIYVKGASSCCAQEARGALP